MGLSIKVSCERETDCESHFLVIQISSCFHTSVPRMESWTHLEEKCPLLEREVFDEDSRLPGL